MNYIAHTIYENIQDVNSAVSVFCALITEKNLTGLFADDVPEYHIHAYILDRIVQVKLVELSSHLKKLNVKLDTFSCEWIMTFFCGYFSKDFEICSAILDFFILDGWPAIYKITLSILKIFQTQLLQTKDMQQL
jgi:hypothetical protein